MARSRTSARRLPWGDRSDPPWLRTPLPDWPDQFDGLEVRVYSANVGRFEAGWSGHKLIDGTTTCYLVTGGRADGIVDDQPFHLRPGQLVLVPSQADLRLGTRTGIDFFWFRFTALVLGGVDLFDLVHPQGSLTQPQDEAAYRFARNIAHQLVNIWQERRPTTAVAAAALMQCLLEPFFAFALDQPDRVQAVARFRPVLHYVQDHLDRPLHVAELARVAGLERSHFTRVFTEQLGRTPASYVREQRLHRLRRALLTSNATLDALADELGFADARHLGRVFRQAQGIPPGEFRRQHRLAPSAAQPSPA